jgi:hypothetical protein
LVLICKKIAQRTFALKQYEVSLSHFSDQAKRGKNFMAQGKPLGFWMRFFMNVF